MPRSFSASLLCYGLAAACFAVGVLRGTVLPYFPGFVAALLGALFALKVTCPVRRIATVVPLVLVCVWLPPDLSTDHHRYLWEGYVLRQGMSPYRHAPVELFDALEHPSEGLINHPEYTAIYPPLAQYVFLAASFLGNHVYAWKATLLLVLAFTFLRVFRRDVSWWWLSPPLLVEGLWNGHLDVLGLVPAAWFVWAVERRRPVHAGMSLACTTGLKIMPLLWAPVAFLHLRGRARLSFCLALGGLLCLLYAPFAGHLPDVFASFRAFAGDWYFNNPFFWMLNSVLAPEWVRPVMGGVMALGYGAVLLSGWDVRRRCLAVWCLLCACSPTVYPWYLLWLLPFTPADKRVWTLVAFTAACASYWVLPSYRADGVWVEAWWWMVPEWLVLAWCAFQLLRGPADEAPAVEAARAL